MSNNDDDREDRRTVFKATAAAFIEGGLGGKRHEAKSHEEAQKMMREKARLTEREQKAVQAVQHAVGELLSWLDEQLGGKLESGDLRLSLRPDIDDIVQGVLPNDSKDEGED